MNNKQFWVGVKEYFLITLGVTMYVMGWIIFLIPNNMIGGGVTGLGSIVQYATNGVIKIGYTYFVVNAGLLVAALFTLGRSFGAKSIYAILLTSVLLNAAQGIFPDQIIQTLALDNGKLMCTIMGGIMVGIGIGLSMSQGGSTGGTDIIALIVNKYRNVSPGRMILILDAVIILSSLLVPSYMADGTLMSWPDKITTVVYGFILITIVSTVLDLYLTGSRQSVQIFVLSPKFAEIADAITNELHRGVTVFNGKGWYTKHDTEVVMVITRKADLNVFLKCINSIDPNAFISVSSVTGVYGQGFDKFKSGNKK
ncbi:MAG: YitT family protein [Bacteroidales bacterium]|nr:YitT family protein [Bacteroidales bacterium]MBR6874842.1 YitT family protein [Bacteroidales bacterium]